MAHTKRKRRRNSLRNFDSHAKLRVQVASKEFTKRKYLHLVMTTLQRFGLRPVFVPANVSVLGIIDFNFLKLTILSLILINRYMSYFSTLASDNEARFYLSAIFFLLTKFFKLQVA